MVLKTFLSFLLLSMMAPHTVWGFSFSHNLAYKQQILSQKLYQSPQWLRLGHYHQEMSGNYKSEIRGNFFLAPDGATNPQAELLATIDSLFGENSTQCRYLARMDWLKRAVKIEPEDILPCPERDEWKRRLGAREIYIVFASGDLNSPGSSFGHTFLRLHNPENTNQLELLDYGVNFAALTGDDKGALYALKGLFGFYAGNYSMLPYHQKIREYTNLEGRDLWEYKLKFTPEEVEFLVDHLLELDTSYSYYYFADKNCSYQMMELLNLLRPQANLTESFHDFVIPLDTVRVLSKMNLLEDEKLRPSLQAEWRTRFAGLDLTQKKELRDIVKDPQKFQFTEEMSPRAKAETLEAALSYLAIKEYREQKERKDDKYALAVQRAKLGLVTDPVVVPPPASPLESLPAMGVYLGAGSYNEKNYLSFKYRRTFHDLLSDPTGLTPFVHLEVLSAEFRYFTEHKNLDLEHFTLINVLSTAPTNILDHPLSWSLDIGTQPKLAPYFDFGAGTSFDLSQKIPTRWVLLAHAENHVEDSKYAGYGGPDMLLLTNWSARLRSLLRSKYLYSFQDHKFMWDNQVGISTNYRVHELRLEYRNRQNIPDWQASYIYFF